jgi:arylsulfatase A-like enzyme
VDIAPTLYDLVGVPSDSLLLHGSSMLDPALEQRTTFMLNNSLRPVDGYYREGWLYIYNAFTGEARAERAPGGMARSGAQAVSPNVPPSLAFNATVAETLDRAAGLFDTTSAFFLQRRARMNAPPRASLGSAH